MLCFQRIRGRSRLLPAWYRARICDHMEMCLCPLVLHAITNIRKVLQYSVITLLLGNVFRRVQTCIDEVNLVVLTFSLGHYRCVEGVVSKL